MTPAELKEHRELLGMTQQQLANELGFKRSHIARLENGLSPIMKQTKLAVLYLSTRTQTPLAQSHHQT